MTTVYLIRHAEAEGNYYRRIHGWYDSGVTARGRKQIDALAERFKDVKLDALYTSDLKRTMATAGAITKYHDIPMRLEPRLREINLGVWEDLPWGNVAYDQPEQLLYFSRDPMKFDIPGRESFPHLQERIYGVIAELADRHDGQTVALVSHGMAIRTFLCKVKGLPPERITEIPHGDNTCVALLKIEDGRVNLEYYNDNSHLTGDISTFAQQEWWKANDSVDVANLRIVPMDMEADEKLYKECYADSWQCAHGNLAGFEPDLYFRLAKRAASREPRALMKVYIEGSKFAGIVELDPDRGAEYGAGWISLCYLVPELRHKNYGQQLIGHAVSYFRSQGRKTVRLHAAVTNKNAVRFYEKNEFSIIARESGIGSDLYLMEMKIK